MQARNKKGQLINQTAILCLDCEEKYFEWELKWLIQNKLIDFDDPKIRDGRERWKNKRDILL